MFKIQTWRIVVTLAGLACIPPSASCAPQPLANIFNNMTGADWSTVQLAAGVQATSQPVYKSNAIEEQTYEGYFHPSDTSSKLAIFSDDGCDVVIDDVVVHGKKNQGQALPMLNESL